MSVRQSVCPHISARIPLDLFPWNLLLRTSIKICRVLRIWLKSDKNTGLFTGGPSVRFIIAGCLNSRGGNINIMRTSQNVTLHVQFLSAYLASNSLISFHSLSFPLRLRFVFLYLFVFILFPLYFLFRPFLLPFAPKYCISTLFRFVSSSTFIFATLPSLQ